MRRKIEPNVYNSAIKSNEQFTLQYEVSASSAVPTTEVSQWIGYRCFVTEVYLVFFFFSALQGNSEIKTLTQITSLS